MFQVRAGRSQKFGGVCGAEGIVLAVYAAMGSALYSQTLMGSGGVERHNEEEEEGAGETLWRGICVVQQIRRCRSMTS